MLNKLVQFSITRPKTVIAAAFIITILFGSQLPKITTDTDPKHMLPVTSPVRQYNDQVEREFELHPDVLVLGVVNEQGIVNKQTLARISDLTFRIQQIPGVIVRDVTSFTTIDNVTVSDGELAVRPLLERIPQRDEELQSLRKKLFENPIFVNRIISPEGKATAIYIPIEPTANGKEIADRIRRLLPKDTKDDKFFLAGDPVARDTFGAEMFRQMGLFSPIAGMVMAIALWFMFRSVLLIVANMAAAMISIIWSMGLLIGLGYPVHIMSSMSPVFLMAIATDTVHIFNEFFFRYRETGDKKRAVMETMAAVGAPVFFSDVTTAVGFASLAITSIIPVRIFGLMVAFGTLAILLMSYTLVPAILVLLREKRLAKITGPIPAAANYQHSHTDTHRASFLSGLGQVCVRRSKSIAILGGILLVIATVGISQIRVNNNMVHWFKFQSAVRAADRVMNEHLGGTSTAYLVIQSPDENAMKSPSALHEIEGLQRALEKDPLVGKTFSVVDYVKWINRVLHDDDPSYYRIPDSAEKVGQYLFLFGMSAKPSDLNNVVDYPFQKANMVLQLKSWDAGVMNKVMARTKAYLATNPLPAGVTVKPAGIAYFNLIWNQEVLWGMLTSFLAGVVLVLILLIAVNRSLLWGVLSFLPLLFTIAVIYGVVGLTGKDFDMPVAVLSTLSLGMAIDFAIHFVGRFKKRYAEQSDLEATLIWTVARPGKGIFLNAILFALGFSVMMFADLTPYITVGVLMAAIMLLSSVTSVIYLPGLIQIFRKRLVKGEKP
ncbi:MAG: MMPL family transporter [Candidatus Tectomicrobia bacterium]|uniref:MMPL family transporter n=1 Tax=Tectimicrobiota bacterium TaxID=2528274 RepID=A0A933LQJ9_UNCTE|nr:MMPL family transporter [Candidatus Tectomicrobia bacterium]